ncbi:hypothetical protein K432DRAFT_385663 [Lepidopterella palustris CBS 459.81]|uniref:Uncharacterized protein n=1 Tax=Lepidopterella palustris CBS 459.81 TaxID=1314670 RepID=A0A8E2E2T2_9PEZI|nr:hypothetical protein K432DRAFT_385663 [Lepidopterella palustris CBS 459.81]
MIHSMHTIRSDSAKRPSIRRKCHPSYDCLSSIHSPGRIIHFTTYAPHNMHPSTLMIIPAPFDL